MEHKKSIDAEKNTKSYKAFGEKFIIPTRNYSKNDFFRKNVFTEKPKISILHKNEIPEIKNKKAITATIAVQEETKPTPAVQTIEPEVENNDSLDDLGIKTLMEISLPASSICGTTNDVDTFDGKFFFLNTKIFKFNLILIVGFFCGSETPSPMRLLRDTGGENSSKWLEANTNDFSLSSFLGHLEDVSEANKKSRNDVRILFNFLIFFYLLFFFSVGSQFFRFR